MQTGKQFGPFLKMLNTDLLRPSNCTPVTYPELKIHVHTKTCTLTFTAALFIAATKWRTTQMPINR